MHANTLRCWLGAAGLIVALTMMPSAHAQPLVIVDDSWADGGRNNGADPFDSNWWTSASINGIEVAVGSLGMVTGSSGRGIHTVFPSQSLAHAGDELRAIFTFQTPMSVGSGGTAGFRVGLFDTLGRAGLNADIAASSSMPSPLYGWGTGASPPGPGTAGLPGYMLDMDVQTGSEDLNFRAHDPGTVLPTGRLHGTTTAFTNISPSGPDGAYTIVQNTTYTGSLTIKRISATQMQVSGTLGTAVHTVTDAFDSTHIGMLAFWANSNVFGVSNLPGEPNNGIDFSNVKIEFIAVCAADTTGDSNVNVLDLLQVITGWGPCPSAPTACPGDIDRNTQVNVLDLLKVITSWGPCP